MMPSQSRARPSVTMAATEEYPRHLSYRSRARPGLAARYPAVPIRAIPAYLPRAFRTPEAAPGITTHTYPSCFPVFRSGVRR
jgi:hypothetical protein